MKKRLLTFLLSGIMIGTLAACGRTGNVTEQPPTAVNERDEDVDVDADAEYADTGSQEIESQDVEAVSDEEEEIISPDHVFDIPEGIWIYGKGHNEWIVTEGLFWHLVDVDGNTAVEGTLYANSEDNFDLFDENGQLYGTYTLKDDDTLFDETYQEIYYPVDQLPEKFPGELAKEIGFDSIVGDWTYQEQDSEDYSQYNDLAFVRIFEDGTYTIRFYDRESENSGVILIELEETPDEGQFNPVYSFFEGGNNYWNGCYTDYPEGEPIYFGNGGSARLIPAEGQG